MIKNNLKRMLELQQLTPYRVIQDTEITSNTVYGLCRNEESVPNGETLDRLCAYLGCQPGDLLKYVEVSDE